MDGRGRRGAGERPACPRARPTRPYRTRLPPLPPGRRLGRGMGHDLVPDPRHCRAAGRPLDLVLDLGWFDHSVGGHCEGLVFAPDGTIVKGLHPRQSAIRFGATEPSPACSMPTARSCSTSRRRPIPCCSGCRRSSSPITVRRGRRTVRAVQAAPRGDRRVLAGAPRPVLRPGRRRWTGRRAEPGRAASLAAAARDRGGPGRLRRGGRRGRRPPGARDPGSGPGPPAHASAHRITAVGHAHMDTAWLWPLRETIRKLARTFANALALLDDYPDWSTPVAGAALRLAQRAPPAAVRPDADAVERGRWCRSGACGSRRTATFPPANRWCASSFTASGSSSTIRRGAAGDLAARLVRVLGRASAVRPPAGVALVPDPEDLLEQTTGSRTTPSGGRASTAPGSSPTSRRRRRTTPT